MDTTVKISYQYKHIVVIIIVFFLFYIAYKNIEKFISNESILNTDGVYSELNDDIYLNNLIVDDIDVSNFKGIIVMWSGTIDTIPSGWVLCDGQPHDGITPPDLRSRFILGSADSTTINTTGGYEKVMLNGNNISHKHNLDWDNFGCMGYSCRKSLSKSVPMLFNTGTLVNFDKYPTNTLDIPSYTNPVGSFINKTGNITNYGSNSQTAHENMPPFYALAYIMKK